ncbi:cytochrome c-type biogenesis protein CcmH [Thalassococcus sp. CAU 1522]|uniref:Cytochrome c-type biogenesis protein n=1 Tax=Thalassococcus arenae TaxID=2851652 RepID=A0ABS6NBV3_9RHOB|nr:cytochrome c-type biogenesis protein [Thalassococcus arenae]MBV2361157.1 cytochrome c-type biogenesis protein CcmH [Thalassococcus arenae]
MTRRASGLASIALAALMALPALAVQPDEVLDDPVLEERARELSKGLRCLVCQNESIDESNASLARDLRLLVRERLVAGDSDDEAITFIVDRYGEFVLLQPTVTGWNKLLWAAGPLLFLIALGSGAIYIKRRASASPETEASLSATERARLRELLDE